MQQRKEMVGPWTKLLWNPVTEIDCKCALFVPCIYFVRPLSGVLLEIYESGDSIYGIFVYVCE